MRKTFYFLLTLIFLISCDQKESENRVVNLTEINLNFKDYNPTEHKSFIDLKIENGIKPIKQQLKISDSGTVNYSFINPKKTEIVFSYENREFNLVVSPNEKSIVDLKITELLDRSKFINFKVTGENEKTNNLILDNTFYLDSLIKQSTNSFSRDGSSPDIIFKKKRMSEMENQLKQFKNFISSNNIDDSTFINWGEAQIRYKAGNDLSFYPYFGPINKSMTDNNPYFKFIEEIKSEKGDELTYQSYLKFLKTLSTSFKIMSNVSNKYLNEREQLKKDSSTNFLILFNIIKQLPKNDERELIMAYAYYNNKKVPNKYQDSLKFYLSDKLLTQVKSQEKDENATLISLLKNYDISKVEKNELLKLYEGIEGKVIFHDFWFTNCAPCMKELPNYNDLISKTNSKNVEFIFYGAYMENEEWEKTRDKFELKGKHHLLTKNQLAFFEKYFGVHGFPHHQLIKSDGKIGEKVRFGVYPNNFAEINKLIEKHRVENSNGA